MISFELFLLLVLLAVMIYLRWSRRRYHARKISLEAEINLLEQQKVRLTDAGLKLLELKEALEREQAKSARLLRNILPERVICDLQENGYSEPVRYENVTVFFSDIVNFTEISSQFDPAELILELSDIFGEFDRIFARYNCQRIKTIGDAYMAVAGLPEPDDYHYRNILRASLEVRAFILQRNQQPRRHRWQMRFGLHSGSVVGGIVGQDKYIYDIFGDTVNVASRMEHASLPMQINVSQQTCQLAADEFEFVPRGSIDVKGKGRVEMFFLEGYKKS